MMYICRDQLCQSTNLSNVPPVRRRTVVGSGNTFWSELALSSTYGTKLTRRDRSLIGADVLLISPHLDEARLGKRRRRNQRPC